MNNHYDPIKRCSVNQLKPEDILDIEIELTGTCNLDCPLCTRNYSPAAHMLKYNERPVEEIMAQLDTYPNIESCCLAGAVSEPTLYKNIHKLVHYLTSRNIRIELYSNASIHSTDWWREFAKLFKPHDRVFFTICGSTQESHEKYRKNSSLRKILDNHKAFKEGQIHPVDTLQFIKFQYNLDEYDSDFITNLRKEFSHECSINTLPYSERFKMIEDDANDIKLAEELARKYSSISEFAIRRHEKRSDENPVKMRCKSLETRFISIDQFGNIHPCFLFRIYNPNEKFNLNYEKINKFAYKFCYECESMTTMLLEKSNLERMG